MGNISEQASICLREKMCTTALLIALAATEAPAQNHKPVAEGTKIRVTHLCTSTAESARLCPAFHPSPIVAAFGGFSTDDQVRLILPESAVLIPVSALTTVQERRASIAGGVGGGVLGLLVGTGIGVFLITNVVPGEELEGGGSIGANLSLLLPVIGGTVAGALIGGGNRWRSLPIQRLQPDRP